MDILKTIMESKVETLVTLAGGYVGGKLIEKAYSVVDQKVTTYIMGKYKKKKFEKEYRSKEKVAIEKQNILPIDHADPYYEYTDIRIISTGKKFFLDCPDIYKKQIEMKSEQISFEKDFYFSPNLHLSDLDDMTGINDLSKLITKHRKIVAEWFLGEMDKAYSIFNGKKFGVYSISNYRLRETEDVGFKIEFYETDYFTHKVMRSVFQELKSKNHPISEMRIYPVEGINHLRPLMTSFGVNTFLMINTEKGEKGIVFAKRSKRTANTDESIWHVTMNEGLSQTDIEGKDISLVKCLHRGLKEELGIKEHHYKEIEKEKFLDLFLVMDNFEIGISSIVEMNTTIDKIENLHSIAQDSVLETEALCAIKFDSKNILKFINENKCTTACLYTLNMVLLREKYI